MPGPSPTSKYWDKYQELGNWKQVAEFFGVSVSTAHQSSKRYERWKEEQGTLNPGVKHGMAALDLPEHIPEFGWVKSQKPDEHGRTYSFFVRNPKEEQTQQDKLESIASLFSGTPPVKFEIVEKPEGRKKKAFISINDLHSGSLAWGKETGYGDWDLDIALDRLRRWLSRLLSLVQAEGVDEIILYYNGDTLHANGKVPMTSTPGTDHVLDVDSRHFKTVDLTGDTIIALADMAAQIADVRLVIKRGNHDGDAYLALLQGAKWRYMHQENVTVEMDPEAYWAYIFGKVALFGHHGDKIKPERMIMRFLEKYRKEIADVEHITVWTGDKHHRKVEQFPGVMWEQASCWTEPDEYGSHYGNQAMAQAVIYDEDEGEVARFTVKDFGQP